MARSPNCIVPDIVEPVLCAKGLDVDIYYNPNLDLVEFHKLEI